jgi:hypothetical protein
MSIATLAMLGLSLWPFNHDSQTQSNRYIIPAWHIDVVRDKFSDEHRCQRWPGKTGQWDKWIFCLTAANVAA